MNNDKPSTSTVTTVSLNNEKNNISESNNNTISIISDLIDKSISLPGVKVNRTSFLMEVYGLSNNSIYDKAFFDGLDIRSMDKIANSVIAKNVTVSSTASFALGLPGGLTMAASIPADVMQNFGFSLRLAQQLAYIYGFEDIFEDDKLTERSKNTLLVFLGIMFAANGSGTLLRVISPNVGKYVSKQIMVTSVTKTAWYPMLKSVSKVVSTKTLTKTSLSGFASKAIPVVGGVASAGINAATMTPMAHRLKNELRKYHLPEEEIIEIIETEHKSFSDRTGDVISDIAAGSINAITSAKQKGKAIGLSLKEVGTKTKAKIKKVN